MTPAGPHENIRIGSNKRLAYTTTLVKDIQMPDGIDDLIIFDIVPIPAFTAENLSKMGLSIPQLLLKLKINTGACLKGIRINDLLPVDSNFDRREYPYLSLSGLKIFYKDCFAVPDYTLLTVKNVEQILGLQPDEKKNVVDVKCTFRAEYTLPGAPGSPSRTYVSKDFRIRVYQNVNVPSPADFMNEITSLRESNKYIYLTFNAPYPATAFSDGLYSGVIDGGVLKSGTAPGSTFVYTRMQLPLQLNTTGLVGTKIADDTQPNELFILSLVDLHTGEIGFQDRNVTIHDMPCSLFVSYPDPEHQNAYYLDLDYGKHGTQNTTINSAPDAKGGLCWYGAGKMFVNCVPIRFGRADQMNNTNLLYYFFTVGKARDEDSMFIACMNYEPCRDPINHPPM
jgi:hypothetical protein